LVPEEEVPTEEDPISEPSTSTATPRKSYFRSIAQLPLPISGRFEVMPPEIVAGAMGKVIQLLLLLAKHLKVPFPHPMVFNGSFSTIGNTSGGAGCHTLYPDGSIGFERGVAMLHENVGYVAVTQGVKPNQLHATDLLGNLLMVYRSPELGTIHETEISRPPASQSVGKQG
jgi:hypothetical protein